MSSPTGLGDEDIRRADAFVLVDADQPGWQEIPWGAAIPDGEMDSATLEIVEIPVDSQNPEQVERDRRRIRRIKGGRVTED